MDRLDDCVRLRRQKREDVVFRLALLHLAHRFSARPNPGEERERAALIKGEPTGGREPSGWSWFSENDVKGTTQRLSTPSHRRQCGEQLEHSVEAGH
jgi:hypothetical protein